MSVAGVAQLVAGNAATQSVDPLDANVTVPAAPAGRPADDTVSAVPYGMLAGAADSVMEVPAFVTVKLAPVAVALL